MHNFINQTISCILGGPSFGLGFFFVLGGIASNQALGFGTVASWLFALLLNTYFSLIFGVGGWPANPSSDFVGSEDNLVTSPY